MNSKKSASAKSVLKGRSVSQVQPLLQIDPLPKRQGISKIHTDILINPQIYPMPVVETAGCLIDPRDFEVSWIPHQSIGHTRVHISAKGSEYDEEEVEYYFYRKLILASATHHSQQMHSEIRTLFMQTAHNVTRQTWQALGWDEMFAGSSTEVEEVDTVPKETQPHEYKDISYVVDEQNRRLLLYLNAAVYGLPGVLAVASKMRRAGWEVKVEARGKPIQIVATLKDDDIMSSVVQFHGALNAVDESVSIPVASSRNSETEPIHEQVADIGVQRVDIEVYPQIFPLPTIQLAALLVLGRFHIKIDGDPTEKIRVGLKPKSIVDADSVEGVFSEALIQASLDEYKLAYYEPIRSYFLKLALSFDAELQDSPLSSYFRAYNPKGREFDYQIWTDDSEIRVSVSMDESARIRLLASVWRLKSKGIFVFEPEGTNGIRVKIRPKPNVQIEMLRDDLNRELQRSRASLSL